MGAPVASQRLVDIVNALYQQHEGLATGNDDDRRQLTLMMAEQARFDLGPHYGTKRADSGRPPSKDAIAYMDTDGKLYAWDWQNGATREPQIHVGDPAGDISDQVFIKVSPVDHLQGTSPTPSPTPIPGPCQLPGREEMMHEGEFLHGYYQAPEGLQRPSGLWIDNHPDWEGIGAWLFDVYLTARTKGTSPADARAKYIATIRQSTEWRAKHPGETP